LNFWKNCKHLAIPVIHPLRVATLENKQKAGGLMSGSRGKVKYLVGSLALLYAASGFAYQFRIAIPGIKGAPNPAAILAVSPLSLSLGQLQVGQQGAGTLTVLNTGNATASGLQFSPATGYTISGTCGSTLAPGAQCTEQVSYTPSTAQPFSGSVGVNGAGTSFSVSVSGTGVASSLAVSTTSLAYGLVGVNSTSSPQTFTLQNTGVGPVSVGAISLPTGATFVANTCSNAVLPASSLCTVSVTITPTAVQPYAGSVTIASNATVSPGPVALSGTGAQNDALFPGSPGIYGGYNWWSVTHTMLWDTPTDNAPPGSVNFETLVPNPSPNPRHIQVFVWVDDTWTGLKVSGTAMSLATCTIGVQCTSNILTIPPGNSRVNLLLNNAGSTNNPAGAAMWIIDSDTGAILRDSSNANDWYFTSTAF
jgi:hypothetical protein